MNILYKSLLMILLLAGALSLQIAVSGEKREQRYW